MDAIIKCFSSYGTVEEREACSPSVSQMPQSTRLQNPAEWRSVTHPVKSASLTLPLSQSSSFNSSHIHLLPLSLFIFYFGPLLFLLHLLPCVLDPWVPTNSPPPPATKVEFHSFIFLFSYFFFPGYQHPSLAPSLLCLDTCSHLSFYLLADLGYCYIKPPLSQVHVELTQKYNVTTLERNTDGELCN